MTPQELLIVPTKGNLTNIQFLTLLESRVPEIGTAITGIQRDIASNQLYFNSISASGQGSVPPWNQILFDTQVKIADLNTLIGRLKSTLTTIETMIVRQNEIVEIEKKSAEAQIAQQNANASLTQSQSTLSPDQLFQLQLQKIEADRQRVEGEKLRTALEQEQAEKSLLEKAKANKNYIIAGVALVIIAISAYFLTRKKA